jgi:hypothetical protein
VPDDSDIGVIPDGWQSGILLQKCPRKSHCDVYLAKPGAKWAAALVVEDVRKLIGTRRYGLQKRLQRRPALIDAQCRPRIDRCCGRLDRMLDIARRGARHLSPWFFGCGIDDVQPRLGGCGDTPNCHAKSLQGGVGRRHRIIGSC